MDKSCDTCAEFTDRGIAFKEVIITCSKCRIAREDLSLSLSLSLSL
ncbi:hypothetical protein RchiOBHm_Chr4g0414571 [Rosa chinensis]|uniref:Uncharacterized protein n=1 Tax=Rosa chinensis TaxID=74649 RepID=A0A2P6QWF1_ROSCH|nr:hypothetical protein RchiOBHm_Chr4g0414571 [Rosa chinensis]